MFSRPIVKGMNFYGLVSMLTGLKHQTIIA